MIGRTVFGGLDWVPPIFGKFESTMLGDFPVDLRVIREIRRYLGMM